MGLGELLHLQTPARELSGLPRQSGMVRLGWFPSAGAVLVPRAPAALPRTDPGLQVIGRAGGTPALVCPLRVGSLYLALLASAPALRPPATVSPPLKLQTLTERALRLAVPVGPLWPAATSSTWPICAGSAGSPTPPRGSAA